MGKKIDIPVVKPLAVGDIKYWRGLMVRVINIRDNGQVECEGVGNGLHMLHLGDGEDLKDAG